MTPDLNLLALLIEIIKALFYVFTLILCLIK